MGRASAARPPRARATRARARSSFALLFALPPPRQPRLPQRYPTLADRLASPQRSATTRALRLLYGTPHDLLTSGGYAAWRVGGTLAVFAAVWGCSAAVRALRAEEEAGRTELVLRRRRRPRRATFPRRSPRSAPAPSCCGSRCSPASSPAGSPLAARPTWRSRWSRPCRCSPASARVASQLAPDPPRSRSSSASGVARRRARAAGGRRHGGEPLGGLRWATPLGWAEELRPFAGAAAARAASCPPLATAALLARRGGDRRAGATSAAACCASRDTRRRALALLRSPAAQALRERARRPVAWLAGIGCLALVLGVLSQRRHGGRPPAGSRADRASSGRGSIATPAGYLGFVVPLLRLAVSLFALLPARGRRAARRPSSGSRRCSRCRSAGAAGSAGACARRRRRGRSSRSPPACSPGRARAAPGARRRRSARSLGRRRELPARGAALPRRRRARLRRRAARERGARLRPRRRRASCGELVGALLGAPGVAARPVAVRPRRARPGRAVRARRGRAHARARRRRGRRRPAVFARRDLTGA